MTEVEAMDAMLKELQKPGKEQDKALLIKTLRVTFKGRRKFIQTTERKSLIKSVVQKYPLLKMENFVSYMYI